MCRWVFGKISIAFVLIGLLLQTAQAGDPERSGERVYQAVCQYCHETGIGPKLTGRQLPSAYIQHVARNGLRAMPAFRITEISHQELASVAKLIETSNGGVE
ncbi:MAG: cytochrome c [Pseudomonadales bacterium]|nr:cytochrome c [Pseudomonadales bacterium]